ncbi:hypothetical protein C6500_18605 [Candidatus Poribacteria bacterium]|nr:MAG: hypothetical protein C6500_18605 [Candidatus Poribacteria bacterium]
MKIDRKFLLRLLTLIILCACARAPQEIAEKSLTPAELSQPESVHNSIVRIVNPPDLRGFGNGFFVAPDKIATNIHLIAGANPVSVHIRGGGVTRSIQGITAYDVKNNLVILKVSIAGPPLPLADSDAVKIGDAISDACIPSTKFQDKAKPGTIIGIRDNDKWFATTLAPDPEVSGAPVLNSENEVIGIEVIEGAFGCAIPSNSLKMLLAESDTVEPLAQWQQRDAIRAYSYVEQAKRKFRDDDYTTMIEMLNEAITLNPEFATAYTIRGVGKLHFGKSESEQETATEAQRYYRSAIDDFDKALQLNPESAVAYQNRGHTQRSLADSESDMGNVSAQQHYQAAIDDYTQAIKRVSNDAASYTDRGTARKNLGQFESETGNMAEAQRHYHAAIDDYTQAIKRKPDYAEAYYGRGLVKEVIEQQEEAKSDLEKAETLKRKQATVRVGNYITGFATGFFVTRNKIATNIHVVSKPGPILVESVDEKKFWILKGVTAFDVKNDLVILKVARDGVPLPLGDSDGVRIGEPVIAVGYSGGEYTVAKGTLHSVRNSDKWLRMEINTIGGSSGSAILNSKGQVIGMDVSGYPSYSYAIPSNALKALLVQSKPTEPFTQWQKRAQISAYHYHSLANQKYGAKHYEDAIADLDKAIALNPELIDAYNGRAATKIMIGAAEAKLGNIEKAQSLYQAAIEDLDEATKLNPNLSTTIRTRAAVRIEFGKLEANRGDAKNAQRLYEMAIQDCTEVIKLEPGGFLAYNSRGIAKFELAEFKVDYHITEAQQLYEAAIEDYTQAIQMAPVYPYAHNNRGYAKVRLGESKAEQENVSDARGLYKTAIEDYTQAIQINSEFAYTHSNRGWAKYLLGKSEVAVGNSAEARKLYEAALGDFDTSIQLDSESDDAYRNRGATKAALGDFEMAITDFDKAIKIDPQDADAYYSRGLAKKALGQTEKAEADFEKAKDLNPDVEK